MSVIADNFISQTQIEQFHKEGYFILESVLDLSTILKFKECVDTEIESVHKEMDSLKTDSIGITHRNKRYFLKETINRHACLKEYAFGNIMQEICKATLGEKAYLFFEQFVIKMGKQKGQPGMKFSWHQDSGYIPHYHPFYVTVWTALDDMSEKNGTVRVLPYSRAGGKKYFEHKRDGQSNDMVGYTGSDKGIPAIVPAGSIVVFSSLTLHCSGENNTNSPRRSFLTQYSAEPIINEKGDGFHNLAIPMHK